MRQLLCKCGTCLRCRYRETVKRIRAAEKKFQEQIKKDQFPNFNLEVNESNFWLQQMKHRTQKRGNA